jgi:hypothetical protein
VYKKRFGQIVRVTMFSKLIHKIGTFGDHQILIAIIVAFCLICLTWGTEKFLATYLFPKNQAISWL